MQMATATSSSVQSFFVTTSVQTPKQSFAYICKLTSVGISSIVYLRSHLPEECFTVKKIDGVRVTQLVPDSAECVKNICQNTRSAMKVLKSGYLRKLEILIYPHAQAEEAIESYIFEYDYKSSNNGQEAEANKENGEDLRRAANALMQKLARFLQSLQELPESAHMGMRIFFTDDTPEDFCPPGFVSLPLNFEPKFANDQVPAIINVGSAKTRYHRIQSSFQSQLLKNQDSCQSSQSQGSQKSLIFGAKNGLVPIVASLNEGLDNSYFNADFEDDCKNGRVKRNMDNAGDISNLVATKRFKN